MACVLAFVLVLALVAPARPDIASFGPRDERTWHYHQQSDTLFKREAVGDTRPYISFTVRPTQRAAAVSWILVSGDLSTLALSQTNSSPIVRTDKYFQFAPCLVPNQGVDVSPGSEAAERNVYPNKHSGLAFHPKPAVMWGGCKYLHQDEQHEETFHNITVDGYYTLWIESWNNDSDWHGSEIVGESVFMNVHGYLSAELYPLLIFFGVSGLLYLVLGMVWIALMACHYQDLLRLQFWVGGVIFIGMLHMAFAFGDLDYINNNGVRSKGLMVIAQILLAGKNTMARLIVLVVSMGFGVVKPRLGDSFKHIVAVGVAYFFFDIFYSVTHGLDQTAVEDSDIDFMIVIPLSALDVGIFLWIFSSLSHTIKILTLRRNEVKLALYVQFRIVLVFCVLAAVGFAIWLVSDQIVEVIDEKEDWRHSWWHESFWHALFFAILLAIVILFRPTNNNKRFAYTPLETGLDDDDEYRVAPNYSSETMKMRTLTPRHGSSNAVGPANTEVDDDLKWVEDNIPSAALRESAFPLNPLDSDEDIMQTRFEVSKMD